MNLKHCSLVLFCSLLLALAFITTRPAPTPAKTTVQPAADTPLLFEANVGQTADEVRYLSRAPGFALFLADGEAVLAPAGAGEAVRMRLPGAAEPRGEEPARARTHYFLGERRFPDVPNYSRVRYTGTAPGVDLVFYPRLGGLEYDFVVAPGADASAAALEIDAPGGLWLEGGELVMGTGAGEIRQRRPEVYQLVDGERRPVEAEFALLAENRVGFRLGDYDSARELVIDPFIEYATYLGRGDEEEIRDIAVGPDGSLYVTGYTASSDFPVAGAQDGSLDGGEDAFVLRFDSSGAGLISSTFLGGNGADRANGVALGPDGSIYVTGQTRSDNLATGANAFQRRFGGGGRDGFAARLNAAGNQLLYLTYLGDTDEDWANDVAVQSSGVGCFVGATKSSQYPTTAGALQRAFAGDPTDGFLTCLSGDGSRAEVSTFFGGDRDDEIRAVAVGPGDALAIAGQTRSNNLQTSALTFQRQREGGIDAFFARLDASGSRLLYSTYLGGDSDDFGNAVTLDSGGAAYVGGFTQSDDFPVSALAFQRTYGTGGDGFVVKFDRNGARAYASYLGGDDEDTVNAVAVDGNGWLSTAGHTKSDDFPVIEPGAVQTGRGDSDGDAFWARFDENGRTLLDSTYLGGSRRDEAFALALDGRGGVYLAGRTLSNDFPASEAAFQPGRRGANDAFAVKIVENLELSTVSAASFDGDAPVAPESIAAAFGQALASAPMSARTRPLPAELGGVRVIVSDAAGFDRTAALFFVSPTQINFEIPPGTADGLATVTVFREGAEAAVGAVRVRRAAPSIFTANSDGEGAPAGLVSRFSGGSRIDGFTFTMGAVGLRAPAPIALTGADTVVVTLFATGLRRAQTVVVLVDGAPQQVLYAGSQGEFVALDQVNVELSPTLAGRGLVEVEILADGRRSNRVRLLLQ